MNLNVNTTELQAQAQAFNREITSSLNERKRADTQVKDILLALQKFHNEITQTRARLNELLAKATGALAFGETHTDWLWSEVERLQRHQSAAEASVVGAQRRASELRSSMEIQCNGIDDEQRLAEATSRIAFNQRRVEQLSNEVTQAKIDTQIARVQYANIQVVVGEVLREIAETNRQLSKAIMTAVKIMAYTTTLPSHLSNLGLARSLVRNVRNFATEIQSTDLATAMNAENVFFSNLPNFHQLESAIIANAISQVGARETSENFVPGKPYGQFHGAWCGDFVRWVLEESGIDIDANGRDKLGGDAFKIARAWAVFGDDGGGGYGRWGTALDAAPGDILVRDFDGTASTGGHVSIVIETNVDGNPNLVRTIGGNEEDTEGGSGGVVRNQVKDLLEENRFLITLTELDPTG